MRRLVRRASTVAAVSTVLVVAATAAVAHPIGGRADLPVPVGLFAIVTGMVLAGTFVMLTLRWTSPRLETGGGQPVGSTAAAARVRRVLQVSGLVVFALTVVAGIFDGDASPLTIVPVVIFVYFWLAVPFVAAVVGDWWRWLSPWGTVSARVNAGVAERPDLVERFGVWPAVVAAAAFGWLTLVSSASARPRSLAVAALVYLVLLVAAGRVVGARSGLRLFDAFHTANEAFAAMAPAGIPGDAGSAAQPRFVRRGWLRGLPALPEWPGSAALFTTLLGVVAYDGLAGSDLWLEGVGSLRLEEWFGTLVLLGVVVLIGVAYHATSMWAARLVGLPGEGRRIARRFAHVLVPVVLGFMLAHYITLVLYEGQMILSTASDPFGRGWDLFGTADWRMQLFLSPTVVWYVQVAAMAAGQAAAMVLSHDRALNDFGAAKAARIQYALLTFIVAVTSLGLFLLSG